MQTAGYFYINRKLISSQLWLDEPFTRGQAWVDLIALTNYVDGMLRFQGALIPIKRGECGWSETRLSDRWRWSRGKVRRFLNELENAGRIAIKTNSRTSIITICNYDEYQDKEKSHGTADGTADGPPTVQPTDTNKKRIRKEERKNNNTPPIPPVPGGTVDLFGAAPAKPAADTGRFEEFWEMYPRHVDKASAKKVYDQIRKTVDEQAIILGAMRYAEERYADDRPGSEKFTKHPKTWLNARGWENYIDDEAEDLDVSQLTPDQIARKVLQEGGFG